MIERVELGDLEYIIGYLSGVEWSERRGIWEYMDLADRLFMSVVNSKESYTWR